jgi:alkylhydroperoxidase family enzyme
MPRFHWTDETDATGDLAAAYADWFAANPGRPRVPDVLKCFSFRPDFFRDVDAMSQRVHFSEGHLSRRLKEMIATYVSALNGCPY